MGLEPASVRPSVRASVRQSMRASTLSNMNISETSSRAPDKMRICVFHSNLNVKNSIIFGNVRIMYAKHFPDTQLCPVMSCYSFEAYLLCLHFNGVWTASDFPVNSRQKNVF